MNVNIHTINTTVDIFICTLIEDIMAVTNEYADLQMLKTYIIKKWPHTKDEE